MKGKIHIPTITMNSYQCDDCKAFFHLEQADEAWPEACPYCGHTSTTWRGDNLYALVELSGANTPTTT